MKIIFVRILLTSESKSQKSKDCYLMDNNQFETTSAACESKSEMATLVSFIKKKRIVRAGGKQRGPSKGSSQVSNKTLEDWPLCYEKFRNLNKKLLQQLFYGRLLAGIILLGLGLGGVHR